MHGSFYLCSIFFVLLLPSAPQPLSCATTATVPSRRILSAPSPSPASTTPPKYTLSSTPTADNSPFFPFYSSFPPPPPPPPSLPPPSDDFATFPANISALVLPSSPKPKPNSKKLVIPIVGAVLSASAVAGLLIFLYQRRRGASEVLYLGNVVNSHTVEDNNNSRLGHSKPESPEIHPLPPLPGQSPKENCVSLTEEEEDEFYSPMASLCGTDMSSLPSYRCSSGLGQVFMGVESGTRNNEHSTCSCSSSGSGSPRRSSFGTISPQVSLSLRRTEPRDSNSLSYRNLRSPPVSLASTSPDQGLTNNKPESFRIFSFLNPKVGFPRISSASTSPERGSIKTPDVYARSSLYSSASTSPDGVFKNTLEASPLKLNDLNQSVKSVLLSTTSLSPERDLSNIQDKSSRDLNLSGHNLQSLTRTNPVLGKSVSASPPSHPPPPFPPPPFPPPRQPPTSQEPPPLTPPSQPFVVKNTGKRRSYSELPLSSIETRETSKAKLKPLHWDKFRASSSRKTSWDRLRSSSFHRLNEEMIETLFVAKPLDSNSKQITPGFDHSMLNQESRVLDPKKSQNIGILLRALNVSTEEVCEALLDGDADALGTELLEDLSRMAPTKEEEQKLEDCKDDSETKLGPAEKFYKAVLNVPFAFKRVDALLYVASFESEVGYLKRSFNVLQAACEELKDSEIFLKLLEAVLETGNRMNLGTNNDDAQAFKLDTLLKLVDVKGGDGRTTFLHFVVQEITQTEITLTENSQRKKLGLEAISSLSSELANINKSAAMDSAVLSSKVAKLNEGIVKLKEVFHLNEMIGSDEKGQRRFSESMNGFLKMAEEEIKEIQTLESSALSSLKEITKYFNGDSAKEEANPFRIFMAVRDFLVILDGVCKEVEMKNKG